MFNESRLHIISGHAEICFRALLFFFAVRGKNVCGDEENRAVMQQRLYDQCRKAARAKLINRLCIRLSPHFNRDLVILRDD